MTPTRRCPKCGTELAGLAAQGLCPVCTAQFLKRLVPDELPSFRPTEPCSENASAATALESRSRRRVGDYELIEEIARGGMGVVYKARQISLNRVVAIKMILAGPFARESVIQRFRLEAEAAAGLRHRHIVPVYEVGENEGQPFFAMAYVDGRNLAECVRTGPMPPEEAAECVQKIAEAIYFAHQRGIIHRDLKPSNILLDKAGELHITDFGLAKRCGLATETELPGEESLSAEDRSQAQITATGEWFGSPNYSPPEQLFGRRGAMGVHSDIYSLGAILYHLITGKPPFAAATLDETLTKVSSEEPASPRSLCPVVPADLETICLKCLEKEPSRRYQSAHELAEELGRFLRDEPILARSAGLLEKSWRWRRRNPGLASLGLTTAVLFMAFLIGAPVALYRIQQESKQAKQSAEARRQQLVRFDVANGNRLASEGDPLSALPWFVAALQLETGFPGHPEAHRTRIEFLLQSCPTLVQLLSQSRRRDDPNYGKLGGARFSSDSRQVATLASVRGQDGISVGEVIVWDVGSGKPVFPALRQPGDIFYVDFTPDGKRLFTTSGMIENGVAVSGQARVWDAKTGRPIAGPFEHRGVVFHAAVNSDGSNLATATRRFQGEDSLGSEAFVWTLGSTNSPGVRLPHVGEVWGAWLAPHAPRAVTAELQRTGHGAHLGFYARLWDSSNGRLLQPALAVRGFARDVRFRPDGVRMVTVTSGKPGQAFLWDIEKGQPLAPTLTHTEAVINAAFNDDATRVVTASLDSSARVWDALTGAALTPPLLHKQGVCHAEFSPDSRRVATASFDFTARVWDATSGAPLTPPLHHSDVVRQVSFSPDGELLLSSSTDQITRLWKLHQNETSVMTLAHAATVWHAEFNADSRLLLTVSQDGTARVWDVSTGKPISPPLRHGGPVFYGCFSPDGRLVATASADRTARIWDAVSGQAVTPPLEHSFSVWHAQFSSDGKRLATSSGPGHWKYFAVKGAWAPPNGHDPEPETNFGEVKIWDVATGQLAAPVLRHANTPTRAEFSPDNRQVFTIGHDHTARVWNAATGELLRKPVELGCKLIAGKLSRDGRHMAASCGDMAGTISRVMLLNAATGELERPSLAHPDVVASVDFSPDGERIVTGCWDGAARIWDSKTGQLACVPMRHGGQLYGAVLSPDGLFVVTASSANSARIWDAMTGEPVTEPLPHGGPVLEAAFSLDGRWLVTSCVDGKARLWKLLPFEIASEDLPAVSEVLSSQTLDASGANLQPLEAEAVQRAWNIVRFKYPNLFSARR